MKLFPVSSKQRSTPPPPLSYCKLKSFLLILFSLFLFSCGGDSCDGSNDGDALPPLTGAVDITGSEYVGDTLTADTSNLEGAGAIQYQWKRGDSPNAVITDISGATSAAYTLTQADFSKYIAVEVTRSGYSGPVVSNIVAAGRNVYIAGYDGNDAVYWKNGNRTVLPKSGSSAYANAIAVVE